jgi:hypothetical protein
MFSKNTNTFCFEILILENVKKVCIDSKKYEPFAAIHIPYSAFSIPPPRVHPTPS